VTTVAPARSPRQNRLLAALPEPDYRALVPHLEAMAMPLGLAVYESGGAQGYVYFPVDSIVSLLYVLENGASTEIAVTGNEGIVGISLFMGGETTPSRAVVQSGGHGYRVRAAVLKLEASVCECYSVVRREYDRLLPDVVGGLTDKHDRTIMSVRDRADKGRAHARRHPRRGPQAR